MSNGRLTYYDLRALWVAVHQVTTCRGRGIFLRLHYRPHTQLGSWQLNQSETAEKATQTDTRRKPIQVLLGLACLLVGCVCDDGPLRRQASGWTLFVCVYLRMISLPRL